MLPECIPDQRELSRRKRIVKTLRKLGKTDEAIAKSLFVPVEWVRSVDDDHVSPAFQQSS